MCIRDRPSFSGTAEPGSTVALYLGSSTTAFATVVVDQDGNWSATLDSALTTAGNFSVRGKATDPAGNVSALGTALNFVFDNAAPTVSLAAVTSDDVINALEKTAGVTLTGSTEAGVQLSLTLGSGSTARSVTPTLNGSSWSYTLTADDYIALGEGTGKALSLSLIHI